MKPTLRPPVYRLVGTLCLVAFAWGCQNAQSSAESGPPSEATKPQSHIPAMTEGGPENARATARFLAGLPAEDEAYPAELLTADWTAHAEAMNAAWAQVEEEHLAPVRAWVESEVANIETPAVPLFYPFGGPDLVGALSFFPHASEYILVGLEAPGELPSLTEIAVSSLASELASLRLVMGNVVDAGYFVTKRMREGFGENRVSGMASVFYIQLARLGWVPLRARYLSLDEQGRPAELETVSGSGPKLLRIDFSHATESAARTLYFISQDLSDDGLAANPVFGRFLESKAPFNSFLKSAQYLPHMQAFGAINRLVKEHSESVLQDDSGLPLRAFPETEWQRSFFGTYEGTLPAYRDWRQADLIQAYRSASSSPLPFTMGYNSNIGGGCLILARRIRP